MKNKVIHAGWWTMNMEERVTHVRTVCGKKSGLVDLSPKAKITCKLCLKTLESHTLKGSFLDVLPGQLSFEVASAT